MGGDEEDGGMKRQKGDKQGGEMGLKESQKKENQESIAKAEKDGTKGRGRNEVECEEEEKGGAEEGGICWAKGKQMNEEKRMRYTKQEWLKTPEEMLRIFADIPEALSNTQEIVDKVEHYSLDSGPLMPVFDIPEEFGTEAAYRERYSHEDLFNEFTRNEKGEEVMSADAAAKKIDELGGYDRLYRIKLEADYLSKLAFEGAAIRYGTPLSDETEERIVFELHIMKTMGFLGYFLIVQDFILADRDMGVSLGPGRGSAAVFGVACCL